jgi:hypothetical protein
MSFNILATRLRATLRGFFGGCWGFTRKIRMTTLTQVRVLNTFKFKVRAQRDCDSLCK